MVGGERFLLVGEVRMGVGVGLVVWAVGAEGAGVSVCRAGGGGEGMEIVSRCDSLVMVVMSRGSWVGGGADVVFSRAAVPAGARVISPEGIDCTTFWFRARSSARLWRLTSSSSNVRCSFSERYEVSSAVA